MIPLVRSSNHSKIVVIAFFYIYSSIEQEFSTCKGYAAGPSIQFVWLFT